jgi:ABC-2 type transport system permease protein
MPHEHRHAQARSPGPATDRAGTAARHLALGLARASVELKSFFREKDTVVFTFSLPIVMLLILGSVFGDDVGAVSRCRAALRRQDDRRRHRVHVICHVGRGHRERSRRRHAEAPTRYAPMPAMSYFLGKIMLVLVTSLAEVALLLAIGVFLFYLSLPTEAGRWLTLSWIFTLGVAACSLLGIALSSLSRSARSASALSNMGMLVLMFASGVYFIPVSELPAPLLQLGSLFPLKWMAQGAGRSSCRTRWRAWRPQGRGAWSDRAGARRVVHRRFGLCRPRSAGADPGS